MYKTGRAFTCLLLKESAANDVINVSLFAYDEIAFSSPAFSAPAFLVFPEKVGRSWRRERGSGFQRQGEACRSVILSEDDVGGRTRVTEDEERVPRGAWTVYSLIPTSTAVAGVWFSLAFVCLSVYPHDISKTDAAGITKLDVQMFLDESWKLI